MSIERTVNQSTRVMNREAPLTELWETVNYLGPTEATKLEIADFVYENRWSPKTFYKMGKTNTLKIDVLRLPIHKTHVHIILEPKRNQRRYISIGARFCIWDVHFNNSTEKFLPNTK